MVIRDGKKILTIDFRPFLLSVVITSYFDINKGITKHGII